MYNVGDRVVYPMYGAGVIEAIENKVIDGEAKDFYVLNVPIGNLKITVSVSKAERLGLRYINSPEEIKTIVMDAGTVNMSSDWNLRNKENTAVLKTGDLYKIMEIFKTLIFKEREKSLSSVEKKLLGTAKQIILSEIILSNGIERSDAEAILMSGVTA